MLSASTRTVLRLRAGALLDTSRWRRHRLARRRRASDRSSLARRLLAAAVKLVFAALAVSLLAVLALRWLPPPITGVMIEKTLSARQQGDTDFHRRYNWVPAERISPHAKRAVVAAEDQRFFEHAGFDLAAMADAYLEYREGERLRGASTISQQTAKNLFLWTERSIIRKGVEAYFTLLIELLWPKQRILETYLNVAEFGHGVFGVEAAARTYFGKTAAELTAPEAALLAAVLPNPLRFRVDRPSAYVRERQAWVLEQMRWLGDGAAR